MVILLISAVVYGQNKKLATLQITETAGIDHEKEYVRLFQSVATDMSRISAVNEETGESIYCQLEWNTANEEIGTNNTCVIFPVRLNANEKQQNEQVVTIDPTPPKKELSVGGKGLEF